MAYFRPHLLVHDFLERTARLKNEYHKRQWEKAHRLQVRLVGRTLYVRGKSLEIFRRIGRQTKADARKAKQARKAA